MAKRSRYRWQGAGQERPHAPVTVRQGPTREPVPMTDGQAKFLRVLCERHGERFNPKWSKAQASKRINQLKARGR